MLVFVYNFEQGYFKLNQVCPIKEKMIQVCQGFSKFSEIGLGFSGFSRVSQVLPVGSNFARPSWFKLKHVGRDQVF